LKFEDTKLKVMIYKELKLTKPATVSSYSSSKDDDDDENVTSKQQPFFWQKCTQSKKRDSHLRRTLQPIISFFFRFFSFSFHFN